MDADVDPRDVADRLSEQRANVAAQLRELGASFDEVVAASRDSNADDEHDPEGATIAFERSQIGSLIRAARARMEEIEAARARLAAGTYGTCEFCGGTIDAERLDARPAARACRTCAQRGAPAR